MRRDMDLVREILRQIEDWEEPMGWVEFDLPERSSEEISYHVHILCEAGLVDALDNSTLDSHEWTATRLTWIGHEFLDAARSDTVWREARSKVGGTLGAVSFEVFRTLLTEIAMRQLGLR